MKPKSLAGLHISQKVAPLALINKLSSVARQTTRLLHSHGAAAHPKKMCSPVSYTSPSSSRQAHTLPPSTSRASSTTGWCPASARYLAVLRPARPASPAKAPLCAHYPGQAHAYHLPDNITTTREYGVSERRPGTQRPQCMVQRGQAHCAGGRQQNAHRRLQSAPAAAAQGAGTSSAPTTALQPP